jgi:hypothetical protein
MHGVRLIVAGLLLVSATAVAAPPQTAPPSQSMLTGLAGLAAWENAAYPATPRPQAPRRAAIPEPVPQLSRTGLAGLAQYEYFSSYSPVPARPAVRPEPRVTVPKTPQPLQRTRSMPKPAARR